MNLLKNFSKFKTKLGPGIITGAADDDPSGVATYSIAGARYGYSMLWMTLFLVPAMVAIQEMCGRIGLVTGKGLAGVIKTYYPKWLLWFSVGLLVVANVINIGADLGIIASVLQMLFGLPFMWWLVITAVLITWMEISVSYKKYSGMLKWLGLVLLVYVLTAFSVKHDLLELVPSFLIPRLEFNTGYVMTLVGFLGTTISPYLFFWQASEEVEEEIAESKIQDFNQKPKVSWRDVVNLGSDTKVGMIFSNMISFFIIITTAGTLHKNGILTIDTPQLAAESLRPIAGDLAYALFAIGIIGIGLQAIPVLSGSVAYAVSEALGAKEGLSKKFSEAKIFYFVIALSTLVGVVLNMIGINTMQALYFAAIANGVVAVPLIFVILKMADDEKIVGRFRTAKVNKLVGWVTFSFMAVSVLFMVWGLLTGQ